MQALNRFRNTLTTQVLAAFCSYRAPKRKDIQTQRRGGVGNEGENGNFQGPKINHHSSSS